MKSLFLLLAFSGIALSAQISWDPFAAGCTDANSFIDFYTASCWSPAQVPGANDTVTIVSLNAVNILLQNATQVISITVTGPSTYFYIFAPLTVTNVTVSGAYINVASSLSAGSLLTVDGGTVIPSNFGFIPQLLLKGSSVIDLSFNQRRKEPSVLRTGSSRWTGDVTITSLAGAEAPLTISSNQWNCSVHTLVFKGQNGLVFQGDANGDNAVRFLGSPTIIGDESAIIVGPKAMVHVTESVNFPAQFIINSGGATFYRNAKAAPTLRSKTFKISGNKTTSGAAKMRAYYNYHDFDVATNPWKMVSTTDSVSVSGDFDTNVTLNNDPAWACVSRSYFGKDPLTGTMKAIIVGFDGYSDLNLFKGVTNFTVKAVNYNTAEVRFTPPQNATCIKRNVNFKVSGGGQADQNINDNGKEVIVTFKNVPAGPQTYGVLTTAEDVHGFLVYGFADHQRITLPRAPVPPISDDNSAGIIKTSVVLLCFALVLLF